MASRCATETRCNERGSALVIAVLVSVVLALLGMSFLIMGETENRIARNEKRALQAMYLAESGAEAVKRWFDYPDSSLGFAELLALDPDALRQGRLIIDETDPYNAGAVTAGPPWYKEGQDLDADGDDDLFDRPYRGTLEHAFLGAADGPDIRIDDADPAQRVFLQDLTDKLAGNFPDELGGVFARISRIDIFAPPYVQVGANWSRFGVASVVVVARIYQDLGAGEQILGERVIQVVLSEAPFGGPYGPLHSCGDLTLTWTGPSTVRWGAVTAEGDVTLAPDPDDLPHSIPRSTPAVSRLDPLWTGNPAVFAAYKDGGAPDVNGEPIDDPWFRLLAGGGITDPAPVGNPYFENPPNPPDNPCVGECTNLSNIARDFPLATCPEYRYDMFKTMATSGGSDVRYFTWDGGDTFRENGVGPARTFRQITHQQEGVYFFDSQDGNPPNDVDGDGRFDNLTPPITLGAGAWFFRGFLFLNAERFQFDGLTGDPVVLNAPGEPFLDIDLNGQRDAGENWINLIYPALPATMDDPVWADKDDNFGGAAIYNERGPDINGSASFHGILYTSGEFEATGTGLFYGSVVARQGVVQSPADGTAATPELYWDEAIVRDWPPDGWRLPRTTVTRWATDPTR